MKAKYGYKGPDEITLTRQDLADLSAGLVVRDSATEIRLEGAVVVRKFSSLVDICTGCDRPDVCAIIKSGTAPCGLNKLIRNWEERNG